MCVWVPFTFSWPMPQTELGNYSSQTCARTHQRVRCQRTHARAIETCKLIRLFAFCKGGVNIVVVGPEWLVALPTVLCDLGKINVSNTLVVL